ncbi:formyltransferase family protein [Arthrobacter sp. MI7-26]|uniref:formyltetrahydrofolate deformylase n=1 Tax=Arthrobacter sp. MI7-26 TaxID=2993653 RepID=UPI002248956E|nr:formyltransferase family protein [Arthrobacter sp. MI7-26]MCX2749253.1 formyltransferase family protein [Arthrobacter sp. MI7-26]
MTWGRTTPTRTLLRPWSRQYLASAAGEHVLTLDCAETPGIVHAVSGFLLEHGCDIVDSKQFGERSERHFFMCVHFASDGNSSTADTLRAAFGPVAERYGMSWRLERHGAKRRVLIMVSKFGHCLNDLLFRARTGELPVEIAAFDSNHTDHQSLVEWHGIPFFHVPVTAATKIAAEARLLELVDTFDVELVVLARYMQVLSDDLTRQLDGRAINIHQTRMELDAALDEAVDLLKPVWFHGLALRHRQSHCVAPKPPPTRQPPKQPEDY